MRVKSKPRKMEAFGNPMDCDDSAEITDITSEDEGGSLIGEAIAIGDKDFQILLQVDKSFSSMSMNDEVRLVRIDLKKLDITNPIPGPGSGQEGGAAKGSGAGASKGGDCSRDSKARFEYGICQIETLKALFAGRATMDDLKFFSDEEDEEDDMDCGEVDQKPVVQPDVKAEAIANDKGEDDEDQQPCSSQQAKERDSKRLAAAAAAAAAPTRPPEVPKPDIPVMEEHVQPVQEAEDRFLSHVQKLVVYNLMEKIKQVGIANNYSHAEWNIFVGAFITEILESSKKGKKNSLKLDEKKVVEKEKALFQLKKKQRKWHEDPKFKRGYAQMNEEREAILASIKEHQESGCDCGAMVCKKVNGRKKKK